MLAKQLLFVACLLGILACGACFVPSHYTPPPPPPIAAEGVTNIGVIVVNASESHHLSTEALASVIVSAINDQSGYIKIKAHRQENSPEEEDAILEVKVLSEAAAPEQTKPESEQVSWNIAIETSCSFTRRNGESIWRSNHVLTKFELDSYAHDSQGMWKDPLVQSSLLRALGNRLEQQVVNQPPNASPTTSSNGSVAGATHRFLP